MNKENVVSLQNITKFYKKTKALNNLNLSIPKGEITSLIGPNGAGKTTTLKIIAGFIKNYSGSIKKNFNSFSYVPEEKILYSNYNVENLLKFNQYFNSKFNKDIQNKLIDIFKINIKKSFRDLSMGQKTGLYLTIEFSRDTCFYILDEPTSALDPLMKESFFTFLKEYNIKYGKTILIASHILEEIENLTDNVAIIKNGKIIVSDNLDTLKEKYNKPLKEIFLNIFNQEKDNVIY